MSAPADLPPPVSGSSGSSPPAVEPRPGDPLPSDTTTSDATTSDSSDASRGDSGGATSDGPVEEPRDAGGSDDAGPDREPGGGDAVTSAPVEGQDADEPAPESAEGGSAESALGTSGDASSSQITGREDDAFVPALAVLTALLSSLVALRWARSSAANS